jgi:deferrochelatase/peroxidase EfeB
MSEPRDGLSRRELLGGAAKLSLVGGALAAGSGSLLAGCGDDAAPKSESADADLVPFTGAHQAGITTPVQSKLVYAAFDLTSTSRDELRTLLQRWTKAIAALAAGQPVGALEPTNDFEVPGDTGEGEGSPVARLTVTVGFGRSMFVTADGTDRFALADQLPGALIEMPPFAGDVIDATRSDGDLSIQCCADDSQTAFYAFHQLARIGRGTAVVRWVQIGFGRASATATSQTTPRNLMGFKDGTNNVVSDDADDLKKYVWVPPGDGPNWMVDGSYVVTRRIRMLLEAWDRTALREQQAVIGRTKIEGAPLGAAKEHDTVDLTKLASDAHVVLAAPESNGGVRILRRGYNFGDGVDPRTGQLDSGLFFIAYQRHPRRQFVPLQNQLAQSDALNEYIKHVANAVFAVPPGVQSTGYLGETLLG